jgi:hypothetical protein
LCFAKLFGTPLTNKISPFCMNLFIFGLIWLAIHQTLYEELTPVALSHLRLGFPVQMLLLPVLRIQQAEGNSMEYCQNSKVDIKVSNIGRNPYMLIIIMG